MRLSPTHFIGRSLYKMAATILEPYASGSNSIVYVTTPNQEVAEQLSARLIAGKLAACVNIIPQVISVFMWQGQVEKGVEQILMIKTRTELVPELERVVKANHPYDVPEVISVKIDQGHLPYLTWIKEVTKNP